jgi:hypothetical protein
MELDPVQFPEESSKKTGESADNGLKAVAFTIALVNMYGFDSDCLKASDTYKTHANKIWRFIKEQQY